MMAARESAVRRRRRKRRRGGEEGEGGGEEGGDGEEEESGEEPHKVCSVITLSSSPYWCLLPILGRNQKYPTANPISKVFCFFSVLAISVVFSDRNENLKVYWVQGLRPSILAVTST